MAALTSPPISHELYSVLVHVSNLPESATQDDVEFFFQSALKDNAGLSAPIPDTSVAEVTVSSDIDVPVAAGSSPRLDANSVLEVKVVTDQTTGRCKGFAFVTVATAAERELFITRFHGASLSGPAAASASSIGGLVVQASKPKKKPPKAEKKTKGIDLGPGGRQWTSKAKPGKSHGKFNPTKSTDTNRRRHF